MKFEWDEDKANSNLSKHRIPFHEAKTVFDDRLYVEFYNQAHSIEEDRYLALGQSSRGRLLVVSYVRRMETIRIIRARKATRNEKKAYEQG